METTEAIEVMQTRDDAVNLEQGVVNIIWR